MPGPQGCILLGGGGVGVGRWLTGGWDGACVVFVLVFG